MFVQVIQGKASDPDGLRGQFDRWHEELADGAEGYLGTTAGVAEDDTFVALVRFESEEAARANSDRPEQGEWWKETAEHLEDDVTFRDAADVETFLEGGSDTAGFVQIIQGTVTNRDRFRQVGDEFLERVHELRPEILGGVLAWDGDFLTQAAYFASEHTAREGEGRRLPDDIQELLDEWQSSVEDLTYIDLVDPWLFAPPQEEDEE